MGLIDSTLGLFGVGSTAATGGNAGYTFDQQQRDFIKLQFKYGLLLKQKLAAGQISQDYYDANFWLTTESLQAPYAGWYDEFKAAIQSENLNWLAKQVGETVDQLTVYMGSALSAVASATGKVLSTAVSATSTGLISGFFGGLNPIGWIVIIGLGAGLVWSFQKGYAQRTLKQGFNTLIP